MTKLKTGDRVVVNNSEDNNPDNDNEGIYIGTTSYGTHIVEQNKGLRYGIHIRSSALDPVEKWEPKTLIHGQWYDVNDLLPSKDGLYICWCKSSTGEKGLIRYHTELGWQYGYKDDVSHWMIVDPPIPIAPSPEEELRDNLIERLGDGFDIWKERITEVLLPIIMQWHNRNKEGEGR